MDLFTAAVEDISFDDVRKFVSTAMTDRLQAESRALEFKRENNRDNVAKAVAALTNTDGGLVIVGVDEEAADPLVGVDRVGHDAVVSNLRLRLPDAMPEVISIAVPDRDRLLLILRVDPDLALLPVVLDGRVLTRIPGSSVGARREEIVALCNRSLSLTSATLPSSGLSLLEVRLWENLPDPPDRPPTEVRARARCVLPRRFEARDYLGSTAMNAIERSLHAAPVPELVLQNHLTWREHRDSQWERSNFSSLGIDLLANRSTTGATWRPAVDAMTRVFLQGRVLTATVAVGVTCNEKSPLITRVAEVHDLLLAASWVAGRVGHASVAALGAGPLLHDPAIDATVRGIFEAGQVAFDVHRTSEQGSARGQSGWPFPSRVVQVEIGTLDEVVKDWLQVPLLEFGMYDFDEELAALPLPRWAKQLVTEA